LTFEFKHHEGNSAPDVIRRSSFAIGELPDTRARNDERERAMEFSCRDTKQDRSASSNYRAAILAECSDAPNGEAAEERIHTSRRGAPPPPPPPPSFQLGLRRLSCI
jgi:hypothetical protein